MPNVTTTLKLDDTPLKEKLKASEKYIKETYNNWQLASDKVTKSQNRLERASQLVIATEKKLAKEVKKGNDANKETVATLKKSLTSRIANEKIIKKQLLALKRTARALKDEERTLRASTKAEMANTIAKKANVVATNNLANTTIRYLRWAGTIAGVLYAAKRAWDATLGIGIKVNKMMEDNTFGISALLSANTQMILSNGQVVDSYEKFQIGQKIASQTMEELRLASVKTYATFPQLTEIFQQAIGQTLSMGDSFGKTTDDIISNTIALSQRMSNIAGAIGMPMDRVREEIRSMLSGNASTDSLISTMLFGSPTAANEAIRDAKTRGHNGVKDMLNAVLEPFDALEEVDSYTRSMLQFQDAWSNTMREMSKPVFDDITVAFGEMAKSINDDSKATVIAFNNLYSGMKDFLELYETFQSFKPSNIAVDFFTAVGETRIKELEEMATLKASLEEANYDPFSIIGLAEKKTALKDLKNTLSNIQTELKQSIELGDHDKTKSLSTELKNINTQIKIFETELGTVGKLMTNIPISASTLKRVLSENGKELDNILKLQTKIVDNNILMGQLGKKFAVADTEKERLDVLEQINAVVANNATQEIKISQEKEKRADKELKDIEKIGKARFERNEEFRKNWEKDNEDRKKEDEENEKDRLKLEKEKLGDLKFYYKTIGQEQDIWEEKEKQILEENSTLTKEQKITLLKILKEEYYDKLEKLEKERNLKQLKITGSLRDGMRYAIDQANKDLPSAFENGVSIMKTAVASLNSAFMDFFDRQSDSFGDFGDLAKSVLADIEKQIIKTQIVQPLVSAGTDILGSVVGSIGSSIFDSLFYDGGFTSKGYADGGRTTRTGSDKQVVGAVHANEYVIPAWMVRKNPAVVAGLEATRTGKKGFDVGGFAGGDVGSSFDGDSGNYGGYGGDDSNEGDYWGNITVTSMPTTIFQAPTAPTAPTAQDKMNNIIEGELGWAQDMNSIKETMDEYNISEGYTSDPNDWGRKIAGWVTAAVSMAVIKDPKAAVLGSKIGEFGYDFFTTKDPTTIDSLYSGTKTAEALEELENKLESLLNDNSNIGEGGSYFSNITGAATTQEIEQIITDAMKQDVIEATSKLFTDMLTVSPQVQDNASLAWNTLFNEYVENGNQALLKTALDGSLFNTANFYKIWEEYAVSINETTEDAIKQGLSAITSTRRGFTEFTLRDDELGLAQYQADHLTQEATAIAEALGTDFASLTSENFLDKYNSAIAESFTPETIAKWDELSEAFMDVTEAQEKLLGVESVNTIGNRPLAMHSLMGETTLIGGAINRGTDVPLTTDEQLAQAIQTNSLLIKLTADNTKQLSTLRAILDTTLQQSA